jgi:transposase InsO family protein
MDRLYQKNTACLANRSAFTPIIYITAVDEGWMYPKIVLSLLSRSVVCLSMQTHMRSFKLMCALRMVWFRPEPEPRLVFHSERGSQKLRVSVGTGMLLR